MNILTGNVTIKRIWELLKKTVTSADLANYSVPIDCQTDSDTKRIPLDELRVVLMQSGLYDYRGDYDASVNLYPSSGGSGTGGLILKSNIWIVSVGGTIDGNVVIPGQTLMAKVDNPGQTSANWAISLAGGSSFDLGNAIHGATAETEILDADEMPFWKAVGAALRKITFSNLKATLKTYFDGIYLYKIQLAIAQKDTDIAAKVSCADFNIPEDCTFSSAFMTVSTAPTGSSAIWDINITGTGTILSTKITIEAGEYSSLDATNQPVFSTTTGTKGQRGTVDCDQKGATVAGQNPILTILYTKR